MSYDFFEEQEDQKEEIAPVKIEKIDSTPGETDQQNKSKTDIKPIQIKTKTKTKQKSKSPGRPKKYSEEVRFFHKSLFGKVERKDTKGALAIVKLLIDEYNLKRFLKEMN